MDYSCILTSFSIKNIERKAEGQVWEFEEIVGILGRLWI
jgi:hypothetical protein